VQAQFNVGLAHFKGLRGNRDYGEAARWFRRAAEQGDARAQGFLGAMYGEGTGMAKDHVQGHAWLNLASANGNTHARVLRDVLAAEMTPSQIDEAQRLAATWADKYSRATRDGGTPAVDRSEDTSSSDQM